MTAADTRKIAANIRKIPDLALGDIVERFVARAEDVGGTFGHGQYQLGARMVGKPRRRGGLASVIVIGSRKGRARGGAGFWAIKSYGRIGGYTVQGWGQPLDLRGAGLSQSAYHSVSPGSSNGDGRWERLIDEIDGDAPDIAARVLEAKGLRF